MLEFVRLWLQSNPKLVVQFTLLILALIEALTGEVTGAIQSTTGVDLPSGGV